MYMCYQSWLLIINISIGRDINHTSWCPSPCLSQLTLTWLFRHWSYACIYRVHVKWQLYWGAGHMTVSPVCVRSTWGRGLRWRGGRRCQLTTGANIRIQRGGWPTSHTWNKPSLKGHVHSLFPIIIRSLCSAGGVCVWSCVMWPCRDSVMLWGKKPGSFCWDISPGTARWRSGKSCTEPKRTTITAISHTFY